MISLFGFTNFPDADLNKLTLISILSLPMIIFHLIGLALYKESNWKISTALTLFIASGLNMLVIVSMLSIQASPEVANIMNLDHLSMFNDYLYGFIVMAIFIGLGTVLYMLDKQSKKVSLIE